MPASCSSSNESSIPSVSAAVEKGTDCLESMTFCNNLYGIISWWYIAMATYSAGSASERKSARYRSSTSAVATAAWRARSSCTRSMSGSDAGRRKPIGSPSQSTPIFPRARPSTNRSGRSVWITCGKMPRGVPARYCSTSPAASTAGISGRERRALMRSTCSGGASPSIYNISTLVFVSEPSIVSQSLSDGFPTRRRRSAVFTRTDSTKASFAPSTLFSTVGAFTPRLSTLLTSKVSAVLSPSRTSAAYPAAISETASSGEKRCRTVQAHTPPSSARVRRSCSDRARSSESGRTISPLICAALTHPSR